MKYLPLALALALSACAAVPQPDCRPYAGHYDHQRTCERSETAGAPSADPGDEADRAPADTAVQPDHGDSHDPNLPS